LVDNTYGQIAERKSRSSALNFLKRLVKEKPLGTVGAIITLLLLLIGIFASFIAPYGMNQSTADLLVRPSLTHWFGTDNLGRDILSRIIYGARISLIVGLVGATISVTLSTIIGMLCGYIGGVFDLLVQRFVDAWMCIPSLILMMVIISIIGPGIWQVTIVMGLCFGISGSRIIRSATMSIKENVYLQAVRSIGCSPSRIIIRHILPNVMASIIILFSTVVPMVILVEASLSFLGYGIPPPNPSWGAMLSGSARDYMFQAPWIIIWPGLALSIVVYGVNMFGDALRDLLDPRMRGDSGRYGVKVKKDIMTSGSNAPKRV
jgi:peptide/nickel transport system permease protein